MAGRYDITPLDTSTRNKMYGNYNELENQILSPEDVNALVGQYGAMDSQGLNDAYAAAQMEMQRQYQPAFEAMRARNYGLATGGQSARDYGQLEQNYMSQLLGQRFQLGADQAARKAAYLRSLSESRVAGRQQRGSDLWNRMLATQKRPSVGQQIGSAALQLAGAGVGAFTGGGLGSTAGGSASPQHFMDNYQAELNTPMTPNFQLREMPNPPGPGYRPRPSSWHLPYSGN